MQSKKRRISLLIVALTVLSLPAISQFNTYSPYTRFGLGDMAWGGFGQNLAMGGTGLAIQDATTLNYLNPAAYAARDSMSVVFDFGLNSKAAKYKTNTQNANWANANFHHIALSVPISKHFAMGSGIVPFSDVGYTIVQPYDDLGTGDAIDLYYNGDGGIMKFFLGLSGTLFNRLSFGVNLNYLLGDIDRERYATFPRNIGYAETLAMDQIALSHTYFGFGMQYKEVFGDKFFFTLAATYDLEANLKSAITQTVTTVFPGKTETLNDTAGTVVFPNVDIVNNENNGTLTLPAKIGFGIALGIPDKLTVTGDYTIQNWEDVNNSSLFEEGFNLANYRSMNAGVEFIPDFEAFRGYHNKMSYRFGAYYKDSYVKINNYQLNDYGITFGVGLPIGKTKSKINVSFAYGTRGTMEYDLIKENYGILTFNVTLHDLWFYKRKYD